MTYFITPMGARSLHLRFGDGSEFVYAWHPELAHQMNQPCELGTVRTRNGTKKRVFVSAPGHLDSITENIAGSTK